MFGKFQTLLDYHTNMVLLMRLVKGGVAGNNFTFHIVYDIRRNRFQFHFGNLSALTFLFENLTAMGTFLGHTFLADMVRMTFARKFLVGEILTAFPTIMAHVYRFCA